MANTAKTTTVGAGPVETKVKAATGAAAVSAGVITPFVVWLLDQLFYHGGAQPDVPLPLAGMIGLLITGGTTFAAGWYTKHTYRYPEQAATRPAQSGGTPAASV